MVLGCGVCEDQLLYRKNEGPAQASCRMLRVKKKPDYIGLVFFSLSLSI